MTMQKVLKVRRRKLSPIRSGKMTRRTKFTFSYFPFLSFNPPPSANISLLTLPILKWHSAFSIPSMPSMMSHTKFFSGKQFPISLSLSAKHRNVLSKSVFGDQTLDGSTIFFSNSTPAKIQSWSLLDGQVLIVNVKIEYFLICVASRYDNMTKWFSRTLSEACSCFRTVPHGRLDSKYSKKKNNPYCLPWHERGIKRPS